MHHSDDPASPARSAGEAGLGTWHWIPHISDEANNILAEQWQILDLIFTDPVTAEEQGLWDMITSGERKLANLRYNNLIWK